ncbi:MAG TPA: hypothetical protein VKR60_08950 [Candidatus Sulfotelmatobacter sp.]|nr:hypothetical protein [Candidatus Sulfotelmatobacter sp.]
MSVTTTQFMRRGIDAAFPDVCHEAVLSQWTARASSVVAIAMGVASKVMQAIVVSLLSVHFNHSDWVCPIRANAIKG